MSSVQIDGSKRMDPNGSAFRMGSNFARSAPKVGAVAKAIEVDFQGVVVSRGSLLSVLRRRRIHFHPNTISPTDTFIEKRFHPMTISSKNGFIQ